MLGTGRAGHSDVVSAQRILDIIKRIADLRGESFACHTVNDVLVLNFREFCATAKGLP
jgi:hypothetical protein